MKTTKFLFALLFSIALVSCSSDDDTTPNDESSIEGEWELTSMEMEGTAEYTMEGIPFPIVFTFEGYGIDIDSQTVFEVDPNTVTSFGTLTLVMSIDMMGETTTEEMPIDFSEYVSSGSWQIEGDQLIITDNEGVESTSKIEQLTATTLVLTVNETVEFEGIPLEYEAVVTYTKS